MAVGEGALIKARKRFLVSRGENGGRPIVDSSVYSIFEHWQTRGELSPEEAMMVEEDLDAFLDSELSRVEQNIATGGDPQVAFVQFTQITSFLSQAINRVPRILSKLPTWVNRIGGTLANLAQQLGADSYSIGVGVPLGLSFDLSFPVQSAAPPDTIGDSDPAAVLPILPAA
jgi:hypothetical protein